MLTLKRVSKLFGRLTVIVDVELEVVQGEKHALIGPNGAGKSTLFNLITGHYRPTSGAILFKDRRIDRLAPYAIIRQGISRSFQIINIFRDMSVYENMRIAIAAKHRLSLNFTSRLARRENIREETETILNRVNLSLFQNEPAGTLGYSQQRALEVGLAVALDPDLLLLDEPGAGLSPEETREIVKLVKEVTAGKTLLIVEHDMDVVFDLADRISVLHHGTILATGTPEEIKNNQTVKEAYLGGVLDRKKSNAAEG